MIIRTTGKQISKGIPGGEGLPMRSGPISIMATMIPNTSMEPHTLGCVISQRRLMMYAVCSGAMVYAVCYGLYIERVLIGEKMQRLIGVH